jgi:serine/threonine protein kinase
MKTRKHKRKNKDMSKSMSKGSKALATGGKVIASGGFGCVFSPALKCEGSKSRGKNRISKLLTKKHALDEYNEIKLFKKKLDKIPNYQNYFLIDDFNICKPAKLDKSDLVSFKSKCSALPKDKITQENINTSLDKVFALNMPNGGLPVDDFIFKNNTYKNIIKLNNTLIKLLNNGIIPMNKNNIYHCDIKDSNILVDSTSNLKARLIDWGLSTEYVANINQPFPKTWRNRPFQFNVPFSIVIFSDLFFDKYSKYIKEGGKLTHESLKPFVIEYIYLWLKERGSGHYSYINNIMFMLFSNELDDIDQNSKEKLIESEFTLPYISNYIIEVLINFTNFKEDGTLNLRVYLDTVFIKIVDIWGFIISYLPIFSALFDNYKKLNETEMEVFEYLKQIFIKYLYTPRITPISVTELTNELKDLNKIFKLTSTSTSTGSRRTSSLKISSTKRSKGVTGQTYLLNSSQKKHSRNSKTRTSKHII